MLVIVIVFILIYCTHLWPSLLGVFCDVIGFLLYAARPLCGGIWGYGASFTMFLYNRGMQSGIKKSNKIPGHGQIVLILVQWPSCWWQLQKWFLTNGNNLLVPKSRVLTLFHCNVVCSDFGRFLFPNQHPDSWLETTIALGIYELERAFQSYHQSSIPPEWQKLWDGVHGVKGSQWMVLYLICDKVVTISKV